MLTQNIDDFPFSLLLAELMSETSTLYLAADSLEAFSLLLAELMSETHRTAPNYNGIQHFQSPISGVNE